MPSLIASYEWFQLAAFRLKTNSLYANYICANESMSVLSKLLTHILEYHSSTVKSAFWLLFVGTVYLLMQRSLQWV
jgi:hypothetical protein